MFGLSQTPPAGVPSVPVPTGLSRHSHELQLQNHEKKTRKLRKALERISSREISIVYPTKRTIKPYQHTISHTVRYHTRCHTVPYHVPYHTIPVLYLRGAQPYENTRRACPAQRALEHELLLLHGQGTVWSANSTSKCVCSYPFVVVGRVCMSDLEYRIYFVVSVLHPLALLTIYYYRPQ